MNLSFIEKLFLIFCFCYQLNQLNPSSITSWDRTNNRNKVIITKWQSSVCILDPPKPFNITFYTLEDNRKFLNVWWQTFGNPEFFTLSVCKLEGICYEEIYYNVTRSFSATNRWTHKINLSLETGRHWLTIESYSNNISVDTTTEFIIGKNTCFVSILNIV